MPRQAPSFITYNECHKTFTDQAGFYREITKNLSVKWIVKNTNQTNDPVSLRKFYSGKCRGFGSLVSKFQSINEITKKYDLIPLYRGVPANFDLLPSLFRYRFHSISELTDIEQKLFNDFYLNAHSYLDDKNKSFLERWAICQHHGLPTRFLDWSENPLIALWFACTSRIPTNGNLRFSPKIWCYLAERKEVITNLESFESLTMIQIYRPSRMIKRIQSQAGVFSIHPISNYSEHWLNKENRLIKFALHTDDINEYINMLRTLNINEFTINQDLDGLSNMLKINFGLTF